jgi:hypothetical protein
MQRVQGSQDQADLRTRLSFLDFDEPKPAHAYFPGEGRLVEPELFASAADQCAKVGGVRILIFLLPVSERLHHSKVSGRLQPGEVNGRLHLAADKPVTLEQCFGLGRVGIMQRDMQRFTQALLI